MRILLALTLSLLLAGCSVTVHMGRAHSRNITAIPTVEHDDDLNEKPDDNHYPACAWQTDMPCESVS